MNAAKIGTKTIFTMSKDILNASTSTMELANSRIHNGVRIGAATVVIAVKVMDNARFPFAK